MWQEKSKEKVNVMKRLFLITLFSIVLAACSNSSTDSGIEQGTDTESFAGDYEGTLELELTADAIGYNARRHFASDN